ncbi:cytochrome C [Mariprofundus sp. EBB-1]|nr:cytochrome C [Mariprofundus sp. EBB-1]
MAALGNAAKGKSLANKCKTCHNFTARKKVGPGLQGVVGRKAGSMTDMKYSSALAAGGWVWNEKNLAAWMCDSKAAVKTLSGNASAKTKMGAQRICDATKQADLIAFLKTL